MHIYIPSRSRSTNVKTLQSIPPDWHSRTFLVVHENEYKDYKSLGYQILTHTENNLADIREWVKFKGTAKNIFMIDDDIDFYYRDHQQKLPKATHVQTKEMFDYFAQLLDKEHWAAVALEKRAFARDPKQKVKYNSMLAGVFGFNRKLLLREDIRFNAHGIITSQDHLFNLTLLTKGFQTIVPLQYVYSAKQYTPGGCNDYRTVEMIEESFKTLAQLFPKYVKRMNSRYPTGNWKYRIAWKAISRDYDICQY